MVRAAFAVLMSVVFLGILGGCGYRVVSYPKRVDVTGVAIENFDNESFDYGYEFVLADAMRKEFARRGAWKLVNDPGLADTVLTGAIRPVNTARRSFSSVVSTIEYEVGVVLRLNIRRPGEVQLGVDSRVIREQELYLASADIEVTRRNRDEALRRLASTLALRVHDVVYEVAPLPDVSAPPATTPSTAAETPAVDVPPVVLPPGSLPPVQPPPLDDWVPPESRDPDGTEGSPGPVESEGVGEGVDWVPPGQAPPPPLEAEDPVPNGDASE